MGVCISVHLLIEGRLRTTHYYHSCFLINTPLFFDSLPVFCRRIRCLHHCLFCECYFGSLDWRDCGGSYRFWILGNNAHSLLLAAWRRRPCAGRDWAWGLTLFSSSFVCILILHIYLKITQKHLYTSSLGINFIVALHITSQSQVISERVRVTVLVRMWWHFHNSSMQENAVYII